MPRDFQRGALGRFRRGALGRFRRGALGRFPRGALGRAGVLALVVFAAAGCATAYVGRAERDYREGRYLEVAEELARHENQLEDLSRGRQARYGLFRGLSLLKLGDYGGAQQWFEFAEGLERSRPTLDANRLRLLDMGRKELKAMQRLERGPLPGTPR